MAIKPLAEKVVVKTIAEENKTETGIFLTGNNKTSPIFAEIIAVGACKDADVELAIGDKIVFPHYVGVEVHIEGADYKILSYNEILAKID